MGKASTGIIRFKSSRPTVQIHLARLMSSPAIQIDQVSKRFGATTALDGLSLAIPTGRCHALVGVNGSGKTTLMNCLLDFLRADSGQIRIQDSASTLPEARLSLSFLPEKFSPPHFLTGREFIDLLLALGGERTSEDKTHEVFAALELDCSALNNPVRHLSKGMAQKLGLAACFISTKPLLVLDEPMSGLDPRARARLKSLIQLRHQSGGTILFSCHALTDIEQLCDGMTVLNAGKVAFHGHPQELRSAFPSNSLERSFLYCLEQASTDAGHAFSA